MKAVLPVPFRSGEQEIEEARLVKRIADIRRKRAEIDKQFEEWRKHVNSQ